MPKQIEYKIYTEDTNAANRSLIIKTVSKHFKAFTVNTGNVGYWEGQQENSLQITTITEPGRKQRHLIERIAEQIRDINRQECVMLTATKIRGKLI